MMSNAGPTPQFYDPIRALLRAGRNDEAIVKLCPIIVTRPDDLVAKELLFDAFFQKRDWQPAFALIDELARRQPDNARLQRQGTSNNDDFVVGSITPAARRSFPLLIWRGCVSAFCARCPVQGPSAGLLRYAAATIRSSVTSRRML